MAKRTIAENKSGSSVDIEEQQLLICEVEDILEMAVDVLRKHPRAHGPQVWPSLEVAQRICSEVAQALGRDQSAVGVPS